MTKLQQNMLEFDKFIDEVFQGALAAHQHDFMSYCYLDGGSRDQYDLEGLKRQFARWSRSRGKGKFHKRLSSQRNTERKKLSSGRYWARSQAGWYLNQKYVKGWHGVNPLNP